MKKTLILFWLYVKRLFCKPSFLAILLGAVLLAGLMAGMLTEDDAVLRVAVVGTDRSEAAMTLVDKLMAEDSVIAYRATDEGTARQLLSSGKTDCVWIFAADFDRAMANLAAGKTGEKPIRILVSESDVFTALAAEKLYAELFPAFSLSFYRNYLTEELGTADGADAYYGANRRETSIVDFALHGKEGEMRPVPYLVTPLRGMLAAMMVVGILACGLYMLSDKEAGQMDAVPYKKRWGRLMLQTLAGGVSMAVFILAALAAIGLWEDPMRELLCMALYILACAGFTALLATLMRRTMDLAALLPIVVMLTLALCPIFLYVRLPILPNLLPTFWYLRGLSHVGAMWGMLGYAAVTWGLSWLLSRLKRRD